MDCSPPGSFVHEILQARILKWVAIPFSRGSSQPKDWTQIFCIARKYFTAEPPGKPIIDEVLQKKWAERSISDTWVNALRASAGREWEQRGWAGEGGEGQWSCPGASDDSTVSSGPGMALPRSPKLKQGGTKLKVCTFTSDQSLPGGCSQNKVITMGRTAFSAQSCS